jgi:hypothetical protein
MKARLDGEMGAPPPASIDVEALMSRGRRQVRLRRFTTVGAGAGLSVAALGAAVAVALNGSATGGATGGAPAGYGASSSAPPSAPASPPASLPGEMLSLAPTEPPGGGKPPGTRLPQPTMTPQTDDEKRMTGVVKSLVAQYAPGYTAAADGSGRRPLEVGSGAWRNADEITYEASATLTVGDGSGYFYLGIGRVGTDYNVATTCAELGSTSSRECVEATGPAGAKIVKITENSYGGRSFIVYVARADGTGVTLIADDGNEHNTRDRTRSTPVFTHDQMVRMGTDPRWTL